MIKAIIIDDEPMARDLLALLIEETEHEIEVVAKCEDLLTGVTQIKKLKPDVVFLDIEMPEVSGLQILEHIPNPDFEIIFATAYDSYAIKAFELSAIDYLLKPIDIEKLSKSIIRLGEKLDVKERLQTYEQNREGEAPIKVCIPNLGRGHDVILIEDILAIEADRNYSIIYTKENKYTLSKSLSYFESKYMPLEGFFRTHRSWIVNMAHIERFIKASKEIIIGEIRIPISRKKYADVKQLLTNF